MNSVQAGTAVVNALVQVAAETGLPLHAHSDVRAVELMFSHHPNVKIIWAHAGMSEPVAGVARLVERYPNLWVELSNRYDVAKGGKLDSSWRELFVRFPDRFLLGTDTWALGRWDELRVHVKTWRAWLAELPEPVAKKIAFENGERLFPPQ